MFSEGEAMSEIVSNDSIVQTAYFPSTPFDAPHNRIVSVARFRKDFPLFADDTVYNDHTVQFWLDIAGIGVLPRFWCQFTVLGQELYAAHFLALQQYNMLRSMGGTAASVPGMPMGLMTSKSVGKVSVGYDYSSSSMEGWGPWNLTMWGQQYAFYAQMVGTGGYETLGVGVEASLVGRVMSWSHGVMQGYYASTG
jgi:hypothetical protein